MEINVKQDCIGVDWSGVSQTLKIVGMAYHEPEAHKRAFEASHTTVFMYHNGKLVAFGRAISDGVYQAAIYDCAVLPEFQGKGLGSTLMEKILAQIEDCNVIPACVSFVCAFISIFFKLNIWSEFEKLNIAFWVFYDSSFRN